MHEQLIERLRSRRFSCRPCVRLTPAPNVKHADLIRSGWEADPENWCYVKHYLSCDGGERMFPWADRLTSEIVDEFLGTRELTAFSVDELERFLEAKNA